MARGSRVCLDFCVSRKDMRAFRRLSGDTNPLHDDPAFARQRGFNDAVVYGSLIVAHISRLLGTITPGPGSIWRSIALHFRKPLYVGAPARLDATVVYTNDTFGLVKLKLRVESAGVLIANGEAEAQIGRVRFEPSAAHALR